MAAVPSFVTNSLGILSPLAYPQDYDVIVVGGVTSPGYCILSGFKRIQMFDKKMGKGTKGATPTMTNQKPAEGFVKFYLWDDGSESGGPDQFALMGNFLNQLFYDPTKQNVQAVDVYHPSLAAIRATQFYCEEIGAMEPEGDPAIGVKTITIKLTEFIPPPPQPAVSTPTMSKPNTPDQTPGQQTDPVGDAQQAQIAQLLQKASEP
jgi:hypothetical protein